MAASSRRRSIAVLRPRGGGSRVVIGLLVLLTLLPFTAPFRVLDAQELSGVRSQTPGTSATALLTADTANAHAVLLSKPSLRVRLVGLGVSKAPPVLTASWRCASTLPRPRAETTVGRDRLTVLRI